MNLICSPPNLAALLNALNTSVLPPYSSRRVRGQRPIGCTARVHVAHYTRRVIRLPKIRKVARDSRPEGAGGALRRRRLCWYGERQESRRHVRGSRPRASWTGARGVAAGRLGAARVHWRGLLWPPRRKPLREERRGSRSFECFRDDARLARVWMQWDRWYLGNTFWILMKDRVIWIVCEFLFILLFSFVSLFNLLLEFIIINWHYLIYYDAEVCNVVLKRFLKTLPKNSLIMKLLLLFFYISLFGCL